MALPVTDGERSETSFLDRAAWVEAIKADPEGQATLRKDVPASSIKALDLPGVEPGHAYRWAMSTETQDRDNDVIEVNGWHWENFLKTGSGPGLWCHERWLPAIFKVTDIAKGGDLSSTVIFPSKAEAPDNTLSHCVRQMVGFGAIPFGSVGFKPDEWTYDEDLKGYRFKRTELLEFSICNVPSNPDAVMRAKAAGVDVSPLREWAVKVLDTIDKADAGWLAAEKSWKLAKSPRIWIETPAGMLIPVEVKAEDVEPVETAEPEPAAEALPVEAEAQEAPPAEPPAELDQLEELAAEFGMSVEKLLDIAAEEMESLADQFSIAFDTPLTGRVPA
jgi:Caudovirus prohead serine protease